jgi:hypothetical protein
VAVLAVAGAAFVVWRLLSTETDYERAIGTLPASTMRATYTDWAAVREAARGDGLAAGSSESEVATFLDRAFERDLVSTSAVAESTVAMSDQFGVSPLDATWEVLGQAEAGQVVVLGVTDDVDLAGVEQRLRSLGYDEPSGGIGTGGTWEGSPDLVARIDPGLSPVHQNAAVLEEQRLVLFSDSAAPVSAAAEVARGDADPLDEAALAEVAEEPVTAVLWATDFACQDLSMSAADPEDQRVADGLVREAGGVSPMTGLVVAQQPDRSLRVGLEFETSDRASDDL